MSASLLSGRTGSHLVSLIRANFINVTGDVRVDQRVESGTFLSRMFKKKNIIDCSTLEVLESDTYLNISYDDEAPDCSTPTVDVVGTITNPFSTPAIVMMFFDVDDDIIIDGEIWRPTDFLFEDGDDSPCPTANGAHSDSYCRMLAVGESMTVGVKNNFRGGISLNADVYLRAT